MVSDRKPRCEAVHPTTLPDPDAFVHGDVVYSAIDDGYGEPLYRTTDVGMARCMFEAGHADAHKNPDGQEWR